MRKSLLVTGCHRSGTTLLATMMAMHNDICLINEDYYDSHKKILAKKIYGTKAVIPSISLDFKRRLIYTSIFRKILFLRRIFKMPHASNFLPYCIDDFDYVVFISRNFDDNVNSIVKRTKVAKKYAVRDVTKASKIKDKLTGRSNVIFIKLKDLTANPEKEMKRLCKFLNLHYEKKMIQGYKYTPTYKNKRIKKRV